jgi:hypothetical protein
VNSDYGADVNEDGVLAWIRERVVIGAPVDDVLGRPGKNLDGAMMVRVKGRKRRRIYNWGTPDCDEALRDAWLERLKVPPRASTDQLRRAEQTSWRVRCVETRTAGSASGLGKRTVSNAGTAPQSDSSDSSA